MKAKYLILILSLTLGAGAAVAAIKLNRIAPVTAAATVATSPSAIPRVVVTASRTQVTEAPIARIVVIGRRVDANQVVAQSN
mgnify:CR=1 FL=1